MQNGSQVSSGLEAIRPDCVFCQRNDIAGYILKETPSFRLVADHAPLVEGHLLIIPRQHYACYGAVPADLDAELFALKREVEQFFQQFYAPVVFWEHGVFRQTVFHAHLHCFPFGTLSQQQEELCEKLCAEVVSSQDDIRAWYATQGQYFYLEPGMAFLFAPKIEVYLHIIQEIFWPRVSSQNNQRDWRSAEQRYQEGSPRIEATIAKWHIFQQQGVVTYADDASTR